MDEKQERRWRRKMIRLWLCGASDRQIQQQVPRSLGWMHKWQQRFGAAGWSGLQSQSRERHAPSGYADRVRQVVRRVRRQLAKRKVGRLVGARAIQREIRRARRKGWEEKSRRTSDDLQTDSIISSVTAKRQTALALPMLSKYTVDWQMIRSILGKQAEHVI